MRKVAMKVLVHALMICMLIGGLLSRAVPARAALPETSYLGEVTAIDATDSTMTIQTDSYWDEYNGAWIPYEDTMESQTSIEDALAEIEVGDYVEARCTGMYGQCGSYVALGKMQSETQEFITDIYGDPRTLVSNMPDNYRIEYENTPDCSKCGPGVCEAEYTVATIVSQGNDLESHQLYPGESFVHEGEHWIDITFNHGSASAYPECSDEPYVGPQAFSDFTVHVLDTIPPAAITDLSANTGSTAGTINLSWTAPGDDGNTGTATQYIVRYNTTPITEANWGSSTDVSGEPTPSPVGSAESMTVGGLTPGQTYYFAIKTQDEVPNTSGISNSPSAVAGGAPTISPIYPLADTISSTVMYGGTAHRYYRLRYGDLTPISDATVNFDIGGLRTGQATSDDDGLVDIAIDSTGLVSPTATIVVSVTEVSTGGVPISITQMPVFDLVVSEREFETAWQGGGLVSGKVGGGVAGVADAYIKGEAGGGIEMTLHESDPLVDTDDHLLFHRQYGAGVGIGTKVGPDIPSPGPVKLSASARAELMFKFMRELEMMLNDPYVSEQQKAQAALLLATLMDIARTQSPLGVAIIDALIEDEAYLDYVTSRTTAFGASGTFNTDVGVSFNLPLVGPSAPIGLGLMDAEASLGILYKKTDYMERNLLGYALEQDGSVEVSTLQIQVSHVKAELLTYLSVAKRVREELFVSKETGQIDHFELSITGETVLLGQDGETTITYLVEGSDVSQELLDSLNNLAVLQAASQGQLSTDLVIGPSAAVREIENLLNNVPVSAYEVKVGDGASVSVSLENLEFTAGVKVGLGGGIELSKRQNSIVKRGGLVSGEQSFPTESYSPYNGGSGKNLGELLSNALQGAWLLVKDSFTSIIKPIESGIEWVVGLFTPKGGATITGGTAVQVNPPAGTSGVQATAATTVTIEAVGWVQDEFAIGGVYQFEPEETTFTPGATLSITYTQSAATGLDESNFLIYRWGTANNNWSPLPSNVDSIANVVTTTITQLGTYAIGYDDTAPHLTLMVPSENGETIENSQPPITVIITDTGSGVNPASIVMKLNDQVVSSQYDAYFHLAWYTPTVPLGHGDYALFVSAEDMAGNEASLSVGFGVRGGSQVYLPVVLRNYTPGTGPTNHPPNTPSNPSPSDGATNQSVNVNLSWTGSDPDGDSVTYDVYFEVGDDTPDALICDDVASAFCDPGTLSYGTPYYWQVVARDSHGATTMGPVWDFTTVTAPVTGWQEVGTGSATSGGISDNSGDSEFPSMAIAPAGTPYVAWRDNSSGDYEIYVRRWNGSSWEEVGTGSASGGGISDNSGDSVFPSVAVAPDGTPYVAWHNYTDWNYEIYVRRWNGSSWEEVGTGSATGGGISDTSNSSTYPSVAIAPDGTPYVVWEDVSSRDWEIYVRRWNGSSWEEVGTGSASSGGISDNSGESWFPSLAVAPDGTPYVAWRDDSGGNPEIYVRRWME